MVDALVHTSSVVAPQQQQAINVQSLASTIKQNMTWLQYFTGFIDAFYWLSPIGKLHDKDKYNLYWSIKAQL